MLRRVLEQGGKFHSPMHQKFKGIIDVLNLSFIYTVSCHCLCRYGCVNKLLVGNPWCGYIVHWGLRSHHSQVSSHFVRKKGGFYEVIALPSRQGEHFSSTQQQGDIPSADLVGYKAMCHSALPLSSTYIVLLTFSLSLFFLSHTPTLAPHLFPSAISLCPELSQNLLQV